MEAAFDKLLDKYTDLVRENEQLKLVQEYNDAQLKKEPSVPPLPFYKDNNLTCDTSNLGKVNCESKYGD